MGIALGQAGPSADQLLRDADAAMYRAKDLGRARIELFSHELQQQVAARFDLEAALRQAIEREELELLYQPIVRLADGRVVGAEALLRWHRAGHGVVLPGRVHPDRGGDRDDRAHRHVGARARARRATRAHRSTATPTGRCSQSTSPRCSCVSPTSLEMVREAIRASGVDPSTLRSRSPRAR